jgi:hypothetical protein
VGFAFTLSYWASTPTETSSIYNLLGQKVKGFEINNPSERTINIELSELAKGNYLAKIYTELNVESIKIIKN